MTYFQLRLLPLLFLAFSSTASATVDCATLNWWWQNKYHADFKVAWPNSGFQCPSEASAIAKAIYDIHQPQFYPGALDFYGYSSRLIRRVVYTPATGPMATMDSNGTMTIYSTFSNYDPTPPGDTWRAATIVHEGRHAEGPFGHSQCTRAPISGFSCDPWFDSQRIWEGGAFSFHFAYLWWVRDGSQYPHLDRCALTNAMSNVANDFVNWISERDLALFGGRCYGAGPLRRPPPPDGHGTKAPRTSERLAPPGTLDQ